MRRPDDTTLVAGSQAALGSDWDTKTIPDLGELPRGAMVGEYRIRRKLAEGGSGTVYAAVHPVIGRKVAIKVIHSTFLREQKAIVRFAQEARAACAIRHRGIVEIFGFGQLPDGRHYMVMEYLQGQHLLDLLRRRTSLTFGEALPLLRGICKAMEAAHGAGVIHRDLKPENVFLLPRADGGWPPFIKIFDFGLAKLLEPEREQAIADSGETTTIGEITPEVGELTKVGATLGTPCYMAPEQCYAQPVDARTDIYAIGVMMYEMMTGLVPFYSPDPYEVMRMHVRDAPDPPSQHAIIEASVERLILDCMAKSAADRPQSMTEVVRRLDELEAEHAPSPRSALRVEPVASEASDRYEIDEGAKVLADTIREVVREAAPERSQEPRPLGRRFTILAIATPFLLALVVMFWLWVHQGR